MTPKIQARRNRLPGPIPNVRWFAYGILTVMIIVCALDIILASFVQGYIVISDAWTHGSFPRFANDSIGPLMGVLAALSVLLSMFVAFRFGQQDEKRKMKKQRRKWKQQVERPRFVSRVPHMLVGYPQGLPEHSMIDLSRPPGDPPST